MTRITLTLFQAIILEIGVDSMEREQLIILVADIRNHRGSDEELLKLIETFNKEVPHPNSFDLILTDLQDLSPEEVVDIALAYKPQILDWSHNS